MDITKEYSELFSSLVSLIRDASSLYSLDVGFLRSIDQANAARSEQASRRLLDLINALVQKCNGPKSTENLHFDSVEDVLRRWNSVEQTFDLLVDKIDAPPKRAKQLQALPPSKSETAQQYQRNSGAIPKPQDSFPTKIDNSVGPFRPLLTQKPFAVLSLKKSVKLQKPDAKHEKEWYEQPYKTEILQAAYPDTSSVRGLTMPVWDVTPFLFVDTPEALQRMMSRLQTASVIAVDVEHHEYRSYLGLVCLLQISASGEDYVIDALKLRSELQELNKVFANPAILKVLHGARMDIQWLQRDLGVYIVGLFDTFFASRALGFPKHSLAYLLQTFADFEAQKKYQLADWRVRPLPQELIDYARADTHFLLYIFYLLRDRLLKEGKYNDVLESSRAVAGIRYEKPGWNESEPAWASVAAKYRLHGQDQLALLVKLFEWRDLKAREIDESPRYVMPPQLLANLCISAPATGAGVIGASHIISPVVRNSAEEIAALIRKTKENPEAVDTSLPEKKSRSATPGASSAVRAVSAAVADSGEVLRRGQSALLGDGHTSSEDKDWARPDIYLGVIEPSSLDIAQGLLRTDVSLNTKADAEVLPAQNSGVSAQGSESPKKEVSVEPSRPAKSTSASRGAVGNSSGKKANIIDSVDDIEHGSLLAAPAHQTPLTDVPAFDFANATPVMSESAGADRKSYRRFDKKGTRSGPQAERGGRKSMAKYNKGTTIRK